MVAFEPGVSDAVAHGEPFEENVQTISARRLLSTEESRCSVEKVLEPARSESTASRGVVCHP